MCILRRVAYPKTYVVIEALTKASLHRNHCNLPGKVEKCSNPIAPVFGAVLAVRRGVYGPTAMVFEQDQRGVLCRFCCATCGHVEAVSRSATARKSSSNAARADDTRNKYAG